VRGKVVIVSDGSGSHPNSRAYAPDRLASLREEEARQAGAELGLKPADMLFLRLPDRFVPSEGEDAERAIGVIADQVRAAGDMIHIAITRRPIKSRARSSFAWGKSDCSSMSSGDIRSHPSRDLATYLRQPGPDRALTDAAVWTLAQPVSVQDLWR
jgi:hypothetical protein